ncbi:MAG: hypothetical protein JXR71_03270 [Bacteroidales bacterium]|nr:hypothetical protein [Bacteroidales bacterium]
MAKPVINKEILIEELVNNYPFSVRFLMERGIRCIMCGEPIWGTLEEACQEKNFTEDDISNVVAEMKQLAENGENSSGPDAKMDVEELDL